MYMSAALFMAVSLIFHHHFILISILFYPHLILILNAMMMCALLRPNNNAPVWAIRLSWRLSERRLRISSGRMSTSQMAQKGKMCRLSRMGSSSRNKKMRRLLLTSSSSVKRIFNDVKKRSS